MKNIEIGKIIVTAKMGSNIGECLQECIELAAKEWRNVELTHNGTIYKINVNDLVSAVKEA